MAISQEQLEEISSNAFKMAAEGKTLIDLGKSAQNPTNDPQQTNGQGKVIDDRVYRYPLRMIDSKTDHLMIKIFQQQRSSEIFGLPSGSNIADLPALTQSSDYFNSEQGRDAQLKQGIAYITLPIPQQISDSLTVSYAEDTLNPLQIAGLNVANEAAKSGFDVVKKVRELINTKNLPGIDSATINAATNALAGIAINQLGANVSPGALITRATGQILQSNLELLFSGVTLRSFPFSFDFTPRDPQEGEMVKQIIRILKESMAPKGGKSGARNSLFIGSPNLFQLEYKTGNAAHPFLNRFKVCALSDLQVNYTASGTYATYGDGTPVHINVAMQFKEINPIYAEDYQDEPGGVGF
jgi:hypothetical protein